MRTVSIKLKDMAIANIQLGFVGENNATQVIFECKEIFDENPYAVQLLVVTPPEGTSYEVTTARIGDNVIWNVSELDTAFEGDGSIQLVFTDGSQVIKTYNADTTVLESQVPSGTAPATALNWIQDAEAWAKGTRGGRAVEDDDPTYQNNSKYYSDKIVNMASDSEAWAKGTRDGEAVESDDPAYQNNSKYYAESIADTASDSEAYAAGTRGGEAVDEDDQAYHNNAAYYNEQAALEKAAAQAAAETASAAYNVNLLADNYDATKLYAVGEYCIYNGGYKRCIVPITTAEAWTSAHWADVTVGKDLSALKSALLDVIKKQYFMTYDVISNINIISGGIAPTTGTNTTSSARARMSAAKPLETSLMVYMESTEYEYLVWCYRTSSTASATESATNKSYVSSPVVIPKRGDNNYYKISFKRTDGADMTYGADDPTSDGYKIKNALRLCYITDVSLQQIGIPADAKAVKDALSIKEDILIGLSNKGNVIGGYVDYGYTQESNLVEEPDASYQGRRVGVRQSMTEIELNASTAPTSSVRIKVSANEVRRSSTGPDVSSWTDGITLESGHIYKVTAHYVSGVINVPENTDFPGVSVYKVGTSSNIATRTYHGYDSELTFIADNDEINLLMYINPGTTMTNAVYQMLLQDITALGESDTNNLFDPKTVGLYDGRTDTISGTASQLYHIVLLEIENEEPCAYNFEWDYSNTVYEEGSDGPTIAALDATGENVEITSVSTGQTATSIKLRNYSSFIHRSISIIFPATARKIVLGKSGSPDVDAVYSFREIKIMKLPSATVRKYPNYYPFKTHTDFVARDEAKNYGFLHDGSILRMASTPAAIPVNENHLGYNEFIAQTWDTLLPDNYVEGDPYNASTTKILNVFVERESRWTSTPFRTNTDTYTIYRYTFTPQNGYDRTVFLTSGCHGNEAEGYWGLFRLIKMIYFEGYKYPTLRNLRNVRFIIVPSWNPWGMQHYRRYNAFSALNTPTYDGGKTHQAWNWLFKPSHSITVDGTVYDIEDVGEANVIWETLNEYKGALNLWIDFHTDPYAGRDTTDVDIDDPRPYTNPYGCYGYSAVGSKTFYRMSNVIEDFYNIFVNELSFTPTYHAKESAPGTGLTSWQATLGFPCALVEVSTFMNDFPYASGSAEMMKIAQEYYGNCLAELLRS